MFLGFRVDRFLYFPEQNKFIKDPLLEKEKTKHRYKPRRNESPCTKSKLKPSQLFWNGGKTIWSRKLTSKASSVYWQQVPAIEQLGPPAMHEHMQVSSRRRSRILYLPHIAQSRAADVLPDAPPHAGNHQPTHSAVPVPCVGGRDRDIEHTPAALLGLILIHVSAY